MSTTDHRRSHMQRTNVLSFKELKQRISLEQVLRHHGLFEGLKLKGKSHRGPCPFCEASDGTPFSVSLEKNCFQCFSCQVSGNILDFVARWEGISIREAGQVLTKNFVDEKEFPPVAQTVEQTTEREAPSVKKADPPAPARPSGGGEAGERSSKALDIQTPAAALPQNETSSRNEPLTFALKNIELDHPSVKALGIHEDVIAAFGVGYYRGRGMMENRIVIPIYNPSRQLVAYAGYHSEERTYTYPLKFRRELELYNLGGALADQGADQGVILVRHPLEALMLISAGHLNAVAIMGDIISDAQVEVLLDQYGTGEKVTLFWPIHTDAVPTLSELLPHFFVRLCRYEERGDTPLGFTAEDVSELLA
jgi:DNA primase